LFASKDHLPREHGEERQDDSISFIWRLLMARIFCQDRFPMPDIESTSIPSLKLKSHRRSTCKRAAMSGFTLIEILIVMLIIGIIMGLAVLSINLNQSSILEDEIGRIRSLTMMAGEEAILQGEEMAVQIHSNGYQFLRLLQTADAWQWAPVNEDRLFRPRCFPPGVSINLEIEGEPAILEKMPCESGDVLLDADNEEEDVRDNLKEDNENEIPKVFLLSSGEMTPFELTLTWEEGGKYTLVGEMTGELEILASGQQEEF
jgi:general secretion pathway protein H